MDYQGLHHSKLVQRSIFSTRNVDSEFAKVRGGNIPVVLIPRSPMLVSLALNVPSGPFVLHQKWHKNMGQLTPGVKWFWPSWNRISHIVSRAVITYNAPAQDCPTADNVLVNVDLSLTFRIGPDADAAANFVYKLGAHRFDELLSVQAEEAIRGLVYSVTHDKVNDLREEFALGVLTTLNSKVNQYGVQIMNVKITDCQLPPELQLRLERTTTFKTKISEQAKTHENKVRVLEDEAIKELETIRKTNARKIQELKAERRKYEVQLREMEEKARGKARVDKVQANTRAEVALKQAKGDDVSEMVKAKQAAEALLKRTDVEAKKRQIEAEQDANVVVRKYEGQLKSAEAEAAALVATAEAEAEGAEALIEKRRYELEWARLDVMETLAGNGRRFISGAKGDAILNDLVPTIAAS
jgi:regulator of protease activity HflC (stomatin/prohibitin superfamily)